MQESLGISIANKLIRYAKVGRENNSFKVLSYGIKFYDDLNIKNTIQQIIDETNSRNIPIGVDIKNERYYYFDIVNLVNKEYARKAIDTEFEAFCTENHLNKNVYEGRYVYSKSLDNPDKNKVTYIYENKSELEECYKYFENAKLTTATPTTAALINLAKVEKGQKCLIVNLEDKTTVTTVINQQIYNIDVLNQGLNEAFEKINEKENSNLKTYEKFKNTTIYTMEMENIDTASNNNEYLQYIVPDLYKLAQEISNISEKYKGINQIYLTGMGTVINNIDLYFQEYFKNVKVEILKPFFIEQQQNINMKDYIEVNSAIALAIQNMGFGAKTLNFKKDEKWDKLKNLLNSDVSSIKSSKTNKNTAPKISFNTNLKGAFDKIEASLVMSCISLLIIMVMYGAISITLKNQIDKKISDTQEVILDTEKQISLASADDTKINSKTRDYQTYKQNLENTSSAIEIKRSRKNQITTLLNRIVYNIPKEVTLTQITNTEITRDGATVQHITINAQAKKYEQLAYLKAKLKNANILDNIVSSEGTKTDEYVRVTIEGDLRTY